MENCTLKMVAFTARNTFLLTGFKIQNFKICFTEILKPEMSIYRKALCDLKLGLTDIKERGHEHKKK